MGGGDLNAKKAWHPNTLKNQERVWKAEQAAAEEKKRIAELERERHLERERAELNKLAKSNMTHSGLPGDDRLHWMYEKPDKKVQQEEYLLGRAIDKNHEQSGKTDADEIPAVSRRVVGSSMLTAAGDTQVDLPRKMREDPLLLVKERERAARAALLNNPVQRAKLAELLRKEQAAKNESKLKKKKKKSKNLDNILAEKLQALSGSSKKGIDLASLLASDDSSSESSDEKAKKKKKKKKKSKSKNANLDDSDGESQKQKSKYDSYNKARKVKKQNKDTKEDDSDHAKRKKRHQYTENEPSKSHVRKHHKDSSEDSCDDNHSQQQKQSSRYSDKKSNPKKSDYLEKSRKTDSRSDNIDNTRKRRHGSIKNESTKSNVKKHYRDSSKDNQSSDEQESSDDEVSKRGKNQEQEDRYWSNKANEYRPKDDKHSRTEGYRKEKHSEDNEPRHEREDRYRHEREHRNRESAPYTDCKNSREDSKGKKDKGASGSNVASFDKTKQGNKRSGLSEAEKASKLAEMMAAGAERERQRERRVADQLAEKEREEKPNTYSRTRNVVQQLPESLESRIHSNRHYIQRDQRHMNENFARR